jgi:tetratricopeptide (TPR) repeat protein
VFYASTYRPPVYQSYNTYNTYNTYAAPSAAPSYESAPIPSGDGWDLLSAGDLREARRAFDRAMIARPGDALAAIGYSISTALLERDQEAVAIMRRALREDPEALHEVPQGVRIDDHLRNLALRYEARSQARRDVDDQFMLAVMRYLLGDVHQAFYALDRGLDLGDSDASAANLRSLIRQAMEQPSSRAPVTAPMAPAAAPTAPRGAVPPQENQTSAPVTLVPADSDWDIPF